MERVPPPVEVTVPSRSGAPSEVLAVGPPPRPPLSRAARAVAGAAVVAVGAGLIGAGVVAARDDRPVAPPVTSVPTTAASRPDAGLTATASLGAARTVGSPVQRLTLTVVLEAYDGRGDSGGRLLGDDLSLVSVGVRGFAVVPDDRRTPIPLGRFGRTNARQTTTIALAATVEDCSVETLARREVVLQVRSGQDAVEVLRATVAPDVVRALDRLVSRTCRRPRG